MGYVGKKPTAAPLTASDVTDGIISNAKLAQDIISAETELAVAPATTDEFLISDAGTLKRIDYSLIKSDPTHVLLSTTTVSSAVAQVDITSNIDSTYKSYRIDLINVIPANDGRNLYMRFFQGGTIDTATVYDFCYTRIISNTATSAVSTGENSNVIQITDSIDSITEGGVSGSITIFDPSSTSVNTHCQFQMSDQRNGDLLSSKIGAGRIEETVAVDGVRFYFDTGNVYSGTFKLYGVN